MARLTAFRSRRRRFALALPLALAFSAFAAVQLASGGDLRTGRSSAEPGIVSPDVVTASTGVCKNVKQAFAVHSYFASSSTSFVPIPGAAVTFTVSGTTNTCLIVSYTVNTEGDGAAGYVGAFLDGAPAGNPSRMLIAYFDPWHSAQATTVLTGVSPGKHTLQMQLQSSSSNLVEITIGTLVVGFK